MSSTGLGNLGPGDFAPLDLQIDVDALLNIHHYDPDSALELLLLAIIDAHQSSEDRLIRLEVAMNALTGKHRKRGMKKLDDYDLLLEIAWNYHVHQVEGNGQPPAIAPIIGRIVEALPLQDPRIAAGTDSIIRRLTRKFKADKDLLVTRAVLQMNFDRMDRLHIITDVALQIKTLGIPLDLTAIRPRLRKPDT